LVASSRSSSISFDRGLGYCRASAGQMSDRLVRELSAATGRAID
jgi:hypothetical protein